MARPSKNNITDIGVNVRSQAERDKRLQLASQLLGELERSNKRLDEIMPSVIDIEKLVIKKYHEEIENESISAKEAISMHRQLIGTIAMIEKVRMDIYDRLSGNVGLYAPDTTNEDNNQDVTKDKRPQNAGTVLNFKQRREAELTCYAVINLALAKKEVNRDTVAAEIASYTPIGDADING